MIILSNNIIIDCCNQLDSRLHSNISKEELLSTCAKKKMVKLYKQENEEFDKLLDSLDRSLDYESYTDVKRCVTKLLKLLQCNRKTLTKTLRRIY